MAKLDAARPEPVEGDPWEPTTKDAKRLVEEWSWMYFNGSDDPPHKDAREMLRFAIQPIRGRVEAAQGKRVAALEAAIKAIRREADTALYAERFGRNRFRRVSDALAHAADTFAVAAGLPTDCGDDVSPEPTPDPRVAELEAALRKIAETPCGIPGHSVAVGCDARFIARAALNPEGR